MQSFYQPATNHGEGGGADNGSSTQQQGLGAGGNMRRAATFHPSSVARSQGVSSDGCCGGGATDEGHDASLCGGGPGSSCRGSTSGTRTSSFQQRRSSNFGAAVSDFINVVEEGDSSSDSSSEDERPQSPTNKQIKKFGTIRMEQSEIQDEIRREVERARETHDCNLSKLELATEPAELLHLAEPTLRQLSLSDNKLTTVGAQLFVSQCPTLVTLDVSNNRLASVPAELFVLPALETLLLDHNELRSLPLQQAVDVAARSGTSVLPSVKRVGLEWNNLTEFPLLLLKSCRHLEQLFIAENEHIFDTMLPQCEDLAEAAQNRDPSTKLQVKMDNRPLVVKHVEDQEWHRKCPWLQVELNKIYPDKVLDFIFLGSLRTAQCETVYRDLDVRYILTAARSLDVKMIPGMKHLVLPVDDLPGEDMTPLFDEAFTFIDEAKASGHGVLIHCFAGLSRSVTVTVAYLMKNFYPMSRDDALASVRLSRPAAQPNSGFMEGLLRYEDTLKLEHQ